MQQNEIDKFLKQVSQTSSSFVAKLHYQKSVAIKPSQLKQHDESDTSSSTDSSTNFEKISPANTKFKKNAKSGRQSQPEKIVSIVNERKLSNSSWYWFLDFSSLIN